MTKKEVNLKEVKNSFSLKANFCRFRVVITVLKHEQPLGNNKLVHNCMTAEQFVSTPI